MQFHPDMSLTSLLRLGHQGFHPLRRRKRCFISVEGNFSGIDALATLTVLLRVKTRHSDNTQTIGTYSYNSGSPLTECCRGIGSTGKYAVPSPQIERSSPHCIRSKEVSRVSATVAHWPKRETARRRSTDSTSCCTCAPTPISTRATRITKLASRSISFRATC